MALENRDFPLKSGTVDTYVSYVLDMTTVTFDWPVALSFTRYILEMLPNGRNNSCKSACAISLGRCVTRIVATSSKTESLEFE